MNAPKRPTIDDRTARRTEDAPKAKPKATEPGPSTALVVATPGKRRPAAHAVVPYRAGAEGGRRSLVDIWLSGLKKTTLRAYEGDLGRFAVYLGLTFLDANGEQHGDTNAAANHLVSRTHGEANELVVSYKKAMLDAKLAPATINRRLSAIRSVVQLANTLGHIPWLIPIKGVKHQKYRDTKGPTFEDVEKMFKATHVPPKKEKGARDGQGARDTLTIYLLYALGLRRAEAASLLVEHFDGGRLSVLGKGKHERGWVTLPKEVASTINIVVNGREREDLLLGRSASGIYKALKRIARAAGVDPDKIRPHGMRHGGITDLLDEGVDKRTVQAFARHLDGRTTEIYDDNRKDSAGIASALITKKLNDAIIKSGGDPEHMADLVASAVGFMTASQDGWSKFRKDVDAGTVAWTSNEVDMLFTSSGSNFRVNYGEDRHILIAAFKRKFASITAVDIPPYEGPPLPEFHGGGGPEHSRLKAGIFFWLKQRPGFAGEIKIEHGYGGYRIDVAVPSENLYVECGDTECSKVLNLIMDGDQVLIVPFCADTGFLVKVTKEGVPAFEKIREMWKKRMWNVANGISWGEE